jgi:hypothetical protein
MTSPFWHSWGGVTNGVDVRAAGQFRYMNRRMAQLENFRLKVFCTVAEHLSFHKTAEHLFPTQPTVTPQVQVLEDELGVEAF